MAFTTGDSYDFSAIAGKLSDVPIYRLGVQGNKKDPEEEAAVKAAFDLLAKTCFVTFRPKAEYRTLVVRLHEPPEGPAEIAGQNG